MYYPGDIVVVRPASEILSTLDTKGACEHLPFMPEMQKFIGKEMKVMQRVDKVCNLAGPMSRVKEAVTLEDCRCDGCAHDGCQMRCAFIWREAWLAPPGERCDGKMSGEAALSLLLRTRSDSDTYYCQATELRRASGTDLHYWYPGQYIRDLRSRTFRPGELLNMLGRGVVGKLFRRIKTRRHVVTPSTEQRVSDQEHLDLQPGEEVVVKSKEEILSTLDSLDRHRGLGFPSDMYAYCGAHLHVAGRVDRIISESTGRMVLLKNTVVLEHGFCDRHRGCGRRMFHLWRETWLRRI